MANDSTTPARVEVHPRKSQRKPGLARTVSASLIGTIAEYYDFFLYGTAASLVFKDVFFPEADPLVGTLAALSTYAVGFFARPLGAIVWGWVGDRIGRKRTLVYTLLLTGIGTFVVGLVPTYEQIGFWAAAILVLIRLLQGFGVGGEQGGAVLLTAEAAPPGRRGYFASFVQLGSPAAYLLPTAFLTWLYTNLSSEQFLSWGWRIPFLASVLVVVIGLWIRLRVPESEAFRKVKDREHTRAPFAVLVRSHRREVIGGILVKFVEASAFPFYTIFLITFADANGIDSTLILDALIFAIIAELLLIPVWGRLTDRFGRRTIFIAGTVINLVLIIPAFYAVLTGNPFVIALLLIAGLALAHASVYAPQASYYPELFPTAARYSGVSIVWQFGAMIASGPFTVVAAALLLAGGGGWGWVAVYVGALALVSLAALLFILPETAPSRIGKEYADWSGRED